MTRAMTSSYTGPLFQLALYASPSKTLDVHQSSGRRANMSRVNAFCGSPLTNCAISKVYAQINGYTNDAIPSQFNNVYNGPYCLSAGAGLHCACPLYIDATTNLPELALNSSAPLPGNWGPCQYTLYRDDRATGITGGSSSDTSLLLVGRAIATPAQCCASFLISHAYNEPTPTGSDFGLGIQYGNTGNWVNCSDSNVFCLMPDLESNHSPNGVSLGSSAPNVVAMVSWNHATNILSGRVNNHEAWTPQAPPFSMNPGTHVHFGGGGDLSVPAPIIFFEGLITNSEMPNADYSLVLANIGPAYPGLSFPPALQR